MFTDESVQSFSWVVISLLGSLMLVFSFIPGVLAQSELFIDSVDERTLLRRKTGWIWIFPILLTALFAAGISLVYPPFIKAGITGPYWLWVIYSASWILFLLVFWLSRFTKQSNCRTICLLLNITGAIPVFILGGIISLMFIGTDFTFNRQDIALPINPDEFRWTGPTNGLEHIDDWRSIFLGLFLVAMSRVTGILFLMKFKPVVMNDRYLRKQLNINSGLLLLFLVLFFIMLFIRPGFQVHEISGLVEYKSRRYFKTILAMPWLLMLFSAGAVALGTGILMAIFTPEKGKSKGFGYSAGGVFLLMLTLFFLAGFGGTPFFPSRPDMQSSLMFSNASAGQGVLIITTAGVVVLTVTVLLLYSVFLKKTLRN